MTLTIDLIISLFNDNYNVVHITETVYYYIMSKKCRLGPEMIDAEDFGILKMIPRWPFLSGVITLRK
jgi:hypothetical protein